MNSDEFVEEVRKYVEESTDNDEYGRFTLSPEGEEFVVEVYLLSGEADIPGVFDMLVERDLLEFEL